MTQRGVVGSISVLAVVLAAGWSYASAPPTWSVGQPVAATAVTDRPELVSASVVASTTAGTAPQTYDVTQVDYVFDSTVGGSSAAAAFRLTGFDGQLRFAGQQAARGKTGHEVIVTFGAASAPVGPTELSNVSIAAVAGGAVQDAATALANPPGSVPLGSPRVMQNQPGVTVAPDLVGVKNFTSTPTDPIDTSVDFVFDKRANVVGTPSSATGSGTALSPHLVLHDGSVITCNVTAGGGTTTLTASCPNSASMGPGSLTPIASSQVSRGYVDPGTVSLVGGQTTPATAALTNVLQAAPVTEDTKQPAPHLTGAVYEPGITVPIGSDQTALVDQVVYTFDQPVTLGTGGTCASSGLVTGSCFLVYTADGHQMSAANTAGTAPTVPGNQPVLVSDSGGQPTEVLATFPAGSLASVVGASVLGGAVTGAASSAPNLADSVAQAFTGKVTFNPGTTDAPSLTDVHIDATASPVTVTYYFDRDLTFTANPLSTASKLYLLDADGTWLSCAHATQANGGSAGSNNTVTCDDFQDVGTVTNGTVTTLGTAPATDVEDGVVGAAESGAVVSTGAVPNVETTVLTDVLPTVTSLAPARGSSYGGATVTITGSGFANARSLHFGDTNVRQFTVVSPRTITAVAPPGAAGPVDVTVTTVNGTSATNKGDTFTYDNAPTVNKLRPTNGSTRGGTKVTITGLGFTHVSKVLFGSTMAAQFTVKSPTSITAVAPKHSAGRVHVRIVTASHGTSDVTTPDVFAFFAPAPRISRLDPTSGPQKGGTKVTIRGANFTRVFAVRFGTISGTRLHVRNRHTIVVTTPKHAKGRVQVRVITASGHSAPHSTVARFTYK